MFDESHVSQPEGLKKFITNTYNYWIFLATSFFLFELIAKVYITLQNMWKAQLL